MINGFRMYVSLCIIIIVPSFHRWVLVKIWVLPHFKGLKPWDWDVVDGSCFPSQADHSQSRACGSRFFPPGNGNATSASNYQMGMGQNLLIMWYKG